MAVPQFDAAFPRIVRVRSEYMLELDALIPRVDIAGLEERRYDPDPEPLYVLEIVEIVKVVEVVEIVEIVEIVRIFDFFLLIRLLWKFAVFP
jgi:hypothetical protein